MLPSILSLLLLVPAMAMPELLTPLAVSGETRASSDDYPPMILSIPPEHDGSDAQCDRLQKRAFTLQNGRHDVGGSHGEKFEKIGCRQADVPSRIDVWYSENINGIRISYEEEDLFVGSEKGAHTKYIFNGIEQITEMKIQARRMKCHETRGVGMISFTTNLGNKFSVKATEGTSDHWGNGYHGIDEYSLNVHGGYLCGMYGRSGSYINQLGFYFMPEVKSAVLTDVTYSKGDIKSQGFYSGFGAQGAIYQSVPVQFNAKWVLDKKEQVTHHWNHKVAVGFNFGVGNKDSLCNFGIHGEYGFQKDTTELKETSRIEERQLSFTFLPMSWNYAEITYLRRSADDLPMNGVMNIVFRNSETYRTKITGAFSFATYTELQVQTASFEFADSFNGRVPKQHELAFETGPEPWWRINRVQGKIDAKLEKKEEI